MPSPKKRGGQTIDCHRKELKHLLMSSYRKASLSGALTPDKSEDVIDFTINRIVGDVALRVRGSTRQAAKGDRWVDDKGAF